MTVDSNSNSSPDWNSLQEGVSKREFFGTKSSEKLLRAYIAFNNTSDESLKNLDLNILIKAFNLSHNKLSNEEKMRFQTRFNKSLTSKASLDPNKASLDPKNIKARTEFLKLISKNFPNQVNQIKGTIGNQIKVEFCKENPKLFMDKGLSFFFTNTPYA